MQAPPDLDSDLIEEVDVFLELLARKLGFESLPLPPGLHLASRDGQQLLMPRIALIAEFSGAPGFVPPSPTLLADWEERALAAPHAARDPKSATIIRATFEVVRKCIRETPPG